MAGIVGIYGLVVAAVIANGIPSDPAAYTLYKYVQTIVVHEREI